jgi:hypothetical protein
MLETTRTYWHQPAAPLAAEPQAPAGLNAAVRSLFAKLSSGAPEAAATPDHASIRRLPAVWETDPGRRPLPRASDGPEEAEADRDRASARRDHAHAAFRTVEGGEQAALDAALGVVEAEIARLRQAVLVYGEALKAIRVYGPDEETREAAAAALDRAPERLRTAAPVPHADRAAAGPADG